jgi:hypothetical protein
VIALLTLCAWSAAIVAACAVVAWLVGLRREVRRQRERRPWGAE